MCVHGVCVRACVRACVHAWEKGWCISPSVNCHTMLKPIDNVALLSWKKSACVCIHVCMYVGGCACMCTQVKIQSIWCYYSFHFYSDAPLCLAHFLYHLLVREQISIHCLLWNLPPSLAAQWAMVSIGVNTCGCHAYRFNCFVADGWRRSMQNSDGREWQKSSVSDLFDHKLENRENSKWWLALCGSHKLSDMLTTTVTDFRISCF